jgi:hypothetical protein
VSAPFLQQNVDGTLGPTRNPCGIHIITMEPQEKFHEDIIQQHHDDLLHGHMGAFRTVDLIQENYQISNLKAKVEKHIDKCVPCPQNKHATDAPYGELQPMPILTKP